MTDKLTGQEITFCELYANGDAPFAGNASRCYAEAFACEPSRHKALVLLSKPEIQEYLQELDKLSYEEAKYMKKFLAQNLQNIISECSQNTYRDRKGQLLSPAPLRSVAVSASKALMELYPVKEAQVNKFSVDGAGDGGITFNVIMPSDKNNKVETDNLPTKK